MATCTTLDVNNYVVATTTPPEQCTGYLLVTYEEYSGLFNDLWQLSPEQGAEIAGHILMVLAIAWVFREVARFLKSSDGESHHE